MLSLLPAAAPHAHAEEEHEHTYKQGKYATDPDCHYPACDVCGYWSGAESGYHEDDNEDCICDVCQYDLHRLVEPQDQKDGTHQGECCLCTQIVKQEHRFTETWDAEQHWFACECGAEDTEKGETNHSYDDKHWYSDNAKHYQRCDSCSYYDPEGEAHDIPSGSVTCVDCTICGTTVHSYVWDRVTWDPTQHVVVCTFCQAEGWENHADGADEDTLCDGCGFNLACPHEDYATQYDEEKHCEACTDCGQAIYNPIPHSFADGSYHWEADKHYPQCTGCNYYQPEGQTHDFSDGKETCNVCNYTAHQYAWDGETWDATYHMVICTVCGDPIWEEHADGADEDALCDVCGFNLACPHEDCEYLYDAVIHYYGCTACRQVVNSSDKAEHSFDSNFYLAEEDKHYPQCDICSYYDPEGEPHNIPEGEEVCDVCHSLVHQYAWDGESWDITTHRLACTVCDVGKEETHADGEDEDALCDVCSFNLACPHEACETQYDAEAHYDICKACGQNLSGISNSAHSYHNGRYLTYDDMHYPKCDFCDYSQPEGEPHKIPGGEEVCDICHSLVHQCVWDGETWSDSYHKVICTVCQVDGWEEHADGEDEDTLCDGCGFNLGCAHDNSEYRYDAVNHYSACTACDQIINSDSVGEHSFNGGRYLAEEDKHYPECDVCSYYDPEGEPHNIPEGGEVCTDCGATVHQYAWDGKTWDTIDHKIICTVCPAERWENHADGEDEDTLCDGCGFNLGCAHDNSEYLYDAVNHYSACTACDQIINSSSVAEHSFNGGRYQAEEDKHYPQCDFCSYSQPEGEAHADTDGNSYCDICNYEIHEHTYAYNNWYTEGGYHYPACDSCSHYDSEKGAQCVDLLVDHVCDVCHCYTDWLCVDADNDHVCDVCQRELHDLCVDADNDHDCDVQTCQRYMWELCSAALEGDWVCDLCGRNFCDHYFENTPVPNGDGTHTALCVYCGYVTEACFAWHYDAAQTTETTHTAFCSCGYEFPTEEHNYSWDVRSLTGHVVYCENCYHQSEPMPHTTQNGTCEICQMQVTPYEDVYVGGVGLKDGQYLDNSGNVTATQPQGGYAYYKDGVLELNDYVYAGHGFLWREYSSGEPEGAALYATKALILVLKGENSLQITRPDTVEGSYNYGDGITSEQDLTVRGEGSLSIQVEDDGIQMDSGDVTIEGGTLTVSSGDHGFDLGDSITVTGGTVQMTAGDDGFNVSGDITISGGSVTIDAEDNGLDSGDGSVEISGGTVEIRTEDVNGIDAWEDVVISGGYITIDAEESGIHAYGDVVISGGDLEVGSQWASAIFTEEGSVEISGGNLTLNAGNDDVIGAPQGEIQLPEGAGDPSDGTLTIVTPFAAALEADGIHLTGKPWDLTVLIVAYDESGMLIDLQVVENPGDVVTPTATGATVKAFFLNGKSAPLCADLPVD